MAVGLGAWMIRGRIRAVDAGRAAAGIARMIDAGEVDRAATFADNLQKADPGLFSEPRLVGVLRRLKAAREQETERARRFQVAMEKAGRAPAGPAQDRAIQDAREMARLDSEKQAVDDLAGRIEAAAREAMEQREAMLRPRLETIGGEVERIEKQFESSRLDQVRFLAMLEAARHSLGELTPEVERAGEAAQSRARGLRERLDAVSERFDGLRLRTNSEGAITEAVAYSVSPRAGAFRRFAEGLRDYVKAYPGDPRSRDFQQVLKEQPLWEAAEQWNDLVGRWKERGDDLSPAEAGRRARDCASFLKRNPAFPGAEDLDAYRKYAEAIARRTAADGPAAKLRRVFIRPIITDVLVVRVRDPRGGERSYYTKDARLPANGELTFHRIVALDGKPVQKTVSAEDVVTMYDKSPQLLVAERFRPILEDESKLRHWEYVMTELVAAILETPRMDPVLQVDLLRAVVPSAGEGSEPFRIVWKDVRDRLEQARINVSVPWIDTDQERYNQVRADAGDLIRGLRPAIPRRGEVLEARARIERAVSWTYRTVGWLARDRDRFELRPGGMVPHEGELGVLVSVGGRAEWKKIGAIVKGKPAIDQDRASPLVEGRPVFVRSW